MSVLLTGGAGYIGSHTLRRLLQLGHRVVVIDDCRRGHAELLRAACEGASDRAQVVPASIADRLVANAISKYDIDTVMHFAADIAVAESVDDPLRYYRNNVANSLALLETALGAGVRRFLFSSSMAVYGQPAKSPVDETHPRAPLHPFGRTKMMFEMALEDAGAATGLGYAILRYANVAGASPDAVLGEWHEPETHLIPLALAAAANGTTLSIHGVDHPTPDGTCVRDYVHVEDVVEAHVAAFNTLMPTQSLVYNVGNERGYSVREVIAACEAVTGKRIDTEVCTRRPTDAATLVAANAKIRAELGWSPRYTDLREIVAHAWAWHQKRHAARDAVPANDPSAPLSLAG